VTTKKAKTRNSAESTENEVYNKKKKVEKDPSYADANKQDLLSRRRQLDKKIK
jgi:hypothetical protein